MGRAYVGFYWTLPVARRPFRKDATSIEEAARRSRTIQYQLIRTKRHVEEAKGDLIDQVAFVELANDRGTKHVEDALSKVALLCKQHKATMLFVDFADEFHWRPHPFMMNYITMHEIPYELVSNGQEYLDGQLFDPAKHFRHWERRQQSEAQAMRAQARQEVQAAVDSLAAKPGRYIAAADDLNARGITTTTGRPWTAESVRKTYVRHTPAE